jgi:hypothetical protein
MINKTLALLISALVLIIAIMTVLNIDQETDAGKVVQGDNTFNDNDLLEEIDDTLIGEDSEIDIGDMI